MGEIISKDVKRARRWRCNGAAEDYSRQKKIAHKKFRRKEKQLLSSLDWEDNSFAIPPVLTGWDIV